MRLPENLFRQIQREHTRPNTETSTINRDHFQSITAKVFLGFISEMTWLHHLLKDRNFKDSFQRLRQKKKKIILFLWYFPWNEQEASKTPDGFANVQWLLYWPILTLSPITEQKTLCWFGLCIEERALWVLKPRTHVSNKCEHEFTSQPWQFTLLLGESLLFTCQFSESK